MAQIAQRFTQSVGEEFANVMTHAMGSGMAVVGTIFLLQKAFSTADALSIVSSVIYGISLIVLFTVSALYHAIQPSRTKEAFQKVDHCSIYLLILGTYTPSALNLIGGTAGIVIFCIVACCAVLGITLNCISVQRFQRLSQFLYLASGWTAMLALVPMSRVLNPVSWSLLLGGGLMYTLGVFFYRDHKHPYMHFVWHLFVLGGAILHFVFVYQFCI